MSFIGLAVAYAIRFSLPIGIVAMVAKGDGHWIYSVSHMVVDLGWVDIDLGVPLSCPSAQPLLPNSNQPRQIWADSETPKIQVNPTQVLRQMNHPVHS